MHISFSGVLSPYTYNCPYAHFLKNVKRVKIPTIVKDEDKSEAEEVSRRMRGIELHDKAAEYVSGISDVFEFTTDTLNAARDNHTYVEQQFFFTPSLEPLAAQPADNQIFVSMRCDAVSLNTYAGTGCIYDWKFANSEFGIARHYDELEFFTACLSAKYQDIGEWNIIIHFPEEDYTLPTRVYSWVRLSRIQQRYIDRISRIINDKFCRATPSKARCRYCSYRSSDSGGSDICEFTVI